MKTMLIGGTVVGLLGVGFYLAANKRTEPAPAAPAPEVAVVVATSQQVSAPVVLDRVVDVSDLDHLLEPPQIPAAAAAEPGPVITRVGYEEPASPKPAGSNAPAIPKAKTDAPIFTFWIGTFGGN